jgi:hypothetical protein
MAHPPAYQMRFFSIGIFVDFIHDMAVLLAASSTRCIAMLSNAYDSLPRIPTKMVFRESRLLLS